MSSHNIFISCDVGTRAVSPVPVAQLPRKPRAEDIYTAHGEPRLQEGEGGQGQARFDGVRCTIHHRIWLGLGYRLPPLGACHARLS